MTIKRCYPVLVGASVVENQLKDISSVSSGTVNGVTFTNNGDGSVTASGTATADTQFDLGISKLSANHKYLIIGCPSGGSATTYYMGNASYMDTGNGKIFDSGSATATGYRIYVKNGVQINKKFYPQLIDLTLRFGSTIADYVYTLEQATAGSGIAWLRSYGFINDAYIPYNAGTIESVEATAKVVRDENGENAVTYPLGSNVLRGLFKLDANNNLYAHGDIYPPIGEVNRRYGIVDLGTLRWSMSFARYFYTTSINTLVKKGSAVGGYNHIICALYVAQNVASLNSLPDKSMSVDTGGNIQIHDSAYSTDIAFRAAMSGVYLVYELATPTTEQSTPFTSPQIVYPDGTEEFVTENGVPVGHETKYQL